MLQVFLVLMYKLLFRGLQHPYLGHLYSWKTLPIYAGFAVGVFIKDLTIRFLPYKGSSASLTSLSQMGRHVYPAPGCEHLVTRARLQVIWVCLPEN